MRTPSVTFLAQPPKLQLQSLATVKAFSAHWTRKRPQKPHNFLYDNNFIFFRVLTVLGVFVVGRNAKGEVRWELRSGRTVFTLCMLSVSLIASCITLRAVLTNLLTVPFSFDDFITYCSFLFCSIFQVIPVIMFFEASKMAAYLRDWDHFQNLFEAVTKRGIDCKPSFKWVGLMLVALLTIVVLFILMWDKFLEIFEKHSLNVPIHLCALITGGYCSLLLCSVFALWLKLTGAVRHAAEQLLQDIESLRWTAWGSLQRHVHLWMCLQQLCLGLGHAQGLTYLYLCGAMFATSLPSIYMGVLALAGGDVFEILTSAHSLVLITALAECSDRAVKAVGSGFQARLTRLLVSGRAAGYEDELTKLISLVASCPTGVSLGGFCTMDRTMNVPMYGSVITYFVIILQLQPPKLAEP